MTTQHRITVIDGGITNRTEGHWRARCVKDCGWIGQWQTSEEAAEVDGDDHVIAVSR